MIKTIRSHRSRLVCLALAGSGLGVSSYLLARSFALISGRSAATLDLCSIVFGADCDSALQSSSDWQLGIPMAGWGLVYYVMLTALFILGWALGDKFDKEASLGALLLSIVGAGISVLLVVTILAGWAPACSLCVIVHFINLALLPALKRLDGRSIAQLRQAIDSTLRFLRNREEQSIPDSSWKALGFVTVALIGVVVYQWVFVEWSLRLAATGASMSPSELRTAYETAPMHDIPLSVDDPRRGPAGAAAQLVVFSSFLCPACRQFSNELARLREHYPSELSIVFKHCPLSIDCNPLLTIDRQPRSCEVAQAAEAARRQDNFWAFHDALFVSDLDGHEETIRALARQLQLNPQEFDSDRKAAASALKVKQDCELGGRLGIDGTPAVFLNGRQIRHWSNGRLEYLISLEIARKVASRDRGSN